MSSCIRLHPDFPCDEASLGLTTIRKAVVVFGSEFLGVAVLHCTKEMLEDSDQADGFEPDGAGFFDPLDPEAPGHGIWIWEGSVVAESDPLTVEAYKGGEFYYCGKWRSPTAEEWDAIREGHNPFGECVRIMPAETFAVLTDVMKARGRWWVSWWGEVGFSLHLPWWITGGTRGPNNCLCAAVLANSAAEARKAVLGSYQDGGAGFSEWRFVEPRPIDWSPFTARFPRAVWMQWPEEEKR